MEILLLTAALGAAGLYLLARALLALRRGRLVAGGGNGVSGLALLLGAGLAFSVAANLHTYARLTAEQPVAELAFEAIGPQRYRVTLRRPGAAEDLSFELAGDEWQLDARFLKWRGLGNLLGLDARFRLERIGARYRDLERERAVPSTVYGLAEDTGLDLWSLGQRWDWLPLVDASYGSATYLPMRDRARFTVTATQSGLIARPVNAPAERSIERW